MARTIHRLLWAHISEANVLDQAQFGGRPHRSSSDILAELYDRLRTDTRPTLMFFLDISKAFDRIHHPTLRDILRGYGVPKYLTDLIADYLTGRTVYLQ